MNALETFVAIHCVGRNYDSCVNSPCQYASSTGCAHPEHPVVEHHDFRDQGNPMEKRDIGVASDWQRNQTKEHTPGLGRR